MDIIVAFVSMALAIIIAAYIVQPLLVRSRASDAADPERDRLIAERNRLYDAIRDLDMDVQTGKVLEQDYRALRERYTARGVEILKQLDALRNGGPKTGGPKTGRRAPGSADPVEAAIQARRKARAGAAPTEKPGQQVDDEIEAAIRARRAASPAPALRGRAKSGQPGGNAAEAQSSAQRKCPSCGHPADPADRFCAKCGTQLTVEAIR